MVMKKIGRNEPCPCGSGKKYKKCCLAKDEAAVSQEQIAAPNGEARIFHDGGLSDDEAVLKDYRKLKKTEEKISFLKKLFPLPADFATDYAIEILTPFHNTMGAEGRHAEAAEIFQLFSEENKEIYEDACSVFDRMLVYHYIFLEDREGIQSILDRFNRSSASSIDDYMAVLVALECFGFYRMALASYRHTWENIDSSPEIMSWGKDEFKEKLSVLTIFEYLFSPEEHPGDLDGLFKTLQVYAQGNREEMSQHERMVNILAGKEKNHWTPGDFSQDDKGFENLFYLSLEFAGWVKDKYGLEALGLGENYRIETLKYLYSQGKKSLLRFSQKKLDEYLARYLRFPAFEQDKVMIALEGVREFYIFAHQLGLVDEDALDEAESSGNKFEKQVANILRSEIWKYSWRLWLKRSREDGVEGHKTTEN
jgi:hypothetical protein